MKGNMRVCALLLAGLCIGACASKRLPDVPGFAIDGDCGKPRTFSVTFTDVRRDTSAHQVALAGVVSDAKYGELRGVVATMLGTASGAITDSLGRFNFEAPLRPDKRDTVVVSFICYETHKYALEQLQATK